MCFLQFRVLGLCSRRGQSLPILAVPPLLLLWLLPLPLQLPLLLSVREVFEFRAQFVSRRNEKANLHGTLAIVPET